MRLVTPRPGHRWIVLWFVGMAACVQTPAPPPYEVLINGIDFYAQGQVADTAEVYVYEREVNKQVSDNFKRTALVVFNWIFLSRTVPPPGTSDGYWWSKYDVIAYQAYVDENASTSSGEFQMFFVSHMVDNPTQPNCSSPVAYGGTLPAINRVPVDKAERWTFMYVTDIQALLGACEDAYGSNFISETYRVNTWTGMITHELGHQRAGLTHPEEYWEFHYQPTDDIMRLSQPLDDMGNTQQHRFCHRTDWPESGDDGSCQANLVNHRIVQ